MSAPPDPDIAPALAGLEAAGMDPSTCAWDSATNWDEFDLVLVRSPWDHAARRQDFLRWARWVEGMTLLANPAVTLARNTDRTYLRDLQGLGLPVVDTVWFEPGDERDRLLTQIDQRGWRRCAVRPHVGTGGAGLVIVDRVDEAARMAQELASGGAVALVQPAICLESADSQMSVIMLGGRVSHAVATSAGFGPGATAIDLALLPEELLDLAESIAEKARAGEKLLYARIDLVNADGQWRLWGFEATDPCLFLQAAPEAAVRLGRTVRQWIMPEAQAADFLVGSG